MRPHTHAALIAEAIQNIDRCILGRNLSHYTERARTWHAVALDEVVRNEDCEGWEFCFADTFGPKATSPLSDDEIMSIWGDSNGTAPEFGREIAIAANVATLKEVAAMPNVTTLTNDSIIDLINQSPYEGTVNSARRVANAALAEFKNQLLSNNSIS